MIERPVGLVGGFLLLAGLAAAVFAERRLAAPQRAASAPRDVYASIEVDLGADDGRLFSEFGCG